MHEHFRAFSFVDRITSIDAGNGIHGKYAIPIGVGDFPPSLVAEAVGQLAAWAVMDAVDFKFRPVAGLAGNIELLAPVSPGQVLELAAQLETVDADAVAYHGMARVNGTPVIRLEHCVGPMMPMDDFDDAAAVRNRFALLCGEGAVPGGFPGIAGVAPADCTGETGKWKRAVLNVPTAAPFFADHFPRRPVFPGTLLMNVNLQLAAALAGELPCGGTGKPWTLRTIADVKLRAFTPPGEILECEAKVIECSDRKAVIAVETRKGKRNVGGAKVLLSAGEQP